MLRVNRVLKGIEDREDELCSEGKLLKSYIKKIEENPEEILRASHGFKKDIGYFGQVVKDMKEYELRVIQDYLRDLVVEDLYIVEESFVEFSVSIFYKKTRLCSVDIWGKSFINTRENFEESVGVKRVKEIEENIGGIEHKISFFKDVLDKIEHPMKLWKEDESLKDRVRLFYRAIVNKEIYKRNIQKEIRFLGETIGRLKEEIHCNKKMIERFNYIKNDAYKVYKKLRGYFVKDLGYKEESRIDYTIDYKVIKVVGEGVII